MNASSLLIIVPVCSLRKPFAREYLETERVPPPATVYGALLSLVGEEDRNVYIGTRIAIALLSKPVVSRLLRTTWRIKDRKKQLGTGNNRKPDYQEILTGLELGVWIDSGPLSDQISTVFATPKSNCRFGGLSLGESRDLVNDVRLNPDWKDKTGFWLSHEKDGDTPLPVWVDHVGSKGTKWGQFKLIEESLATPETNDARWIEISPPVDDVSKKSRSKKEY